MKVLLNESQLLGIIDECYNKIDLFLEREIRLNEFIDNITLLEKFDLVEAEYKGKTVKLNKIMQGDVKKFKVYVMNKKGNVVKVNFGSKDYKIKKNNPKRKKSYCARAKGIKGGGKDKTKANYWSLKNLEL